MNRALTVAVVLAVVAGSVPAAASLADGTPSSPQPGASFAGVVGVQGAEVDNEMANRSLSQQLRAAESNRSKASVVASESQQLADRLAELEAQKARLKAAYENGSISEGQYKARLAVLAAELRAVERRANRTAGVAGQLPREALQEAGANVSHVRQIAQSANRTGGGEVAEAARQIAGEGVGDGLGNPPAHAGPPNGSETGPPESAGPPVDAGNAGPPNGTETGPPENAGPPGDAGNAGPLGDAGNAGPLGDAGNAGPPTDGANASNRSTADQRAGNAANASEWADSPATGNVSSPGRAANATNRSTAGGADGDSGAAVNATNATNRSEPGRHGNANGKNVSSPQNASNTTANGSDSLRFPWQDVGDGRQQTNDGGNETATAAESLGRATFSLAAAP